MGYRHKLIKDIEGYIDRMVQEAKRAGRSTEAEGWAFMGELLGTGWTEEQYWEMFKREIKDALRMLPKRDKRYLAAWKAWVVERTKEATDKSYQRQLITPPFWRDAQGQLRLEENFDYWWALNEERVKRILRQELKKR